MMPVDLAEWEMKARANYSYIPDAVGSDVWTDHSADVEAGIPWQDDCDGLAETVASLCVIAGLAKKNAYRLFVTDINGVGHMVSGIQCDDLSWWVVGDTWFGAPYPANQMPHTPHDYNCMAEVVPIPIWRLGVPWKLGQAA